MRVGRTFAAACILLALPAEATADGSFPWHERASAYGHLSLSFTVDRLTFGARGWSATLAIRNWDIALSVHEDFALLASSGRAFPATRVRPALPAVLGVRGSWRGTIGGPGALPRGSSVRLRLGTFRAVIAPNLFIRYVTRHADRLR